MNPILGQVGLCALVDVVLVGVAERRRHQQTKTNLTKNWIHS
jgi:hypothetical protein